MTLSLAARNLLRNRRRSIATLLALAIGTTSVLLFGGYIADIRNTMLTAYVANGGHLRIQHKDLFLYGNGNPTVYGIADYERLIDAIRNDAILKPMLRVATPSLQFVGVAGNYSAGVSLTVVGSGFIADDLSRMREWNEFSLRRKPEPYALLGTPPDSAYVGMGVARMLLLCAPLNVKDCPQPEAKAANGSGASVPADIAALTEVERPTSKAATPEGKTRIELLATQPRGSPNVATLTIVKAEAMGFKELDEVAVVLHLPRAQKLVYSRDAGRVTSIMIQLEHTASMPAATERLQALLKEVAPDKPLVVMDFQALNPWYTQTVQLFNTILGFIAGLIGALVLFTVSNTMTAAVVERTAEVGTVRAIGLRRRGIQHLFLTEGLLLGIGGALVGLFAAITLSTIVNISKLTWLPPGTSTPLDLTIRVWGESGMIIGAVIGLTAIAALSAWWPARRAARLNIVDALRHA